MFGVLYDKSKKVVYTLLILYLASEILNWKKQKNVNALSNFKFQVSVFWIR